VGITAYAELLEGKPAISMSNLLSKKDVMAAILKLWP